MKSVFKKSYLRLIHPPMFQRTALRYLVSFETIYLTHHCLRYETNDYIIFFAGWNIRRYEERESAVKISDTISLSLTS